MDKFATVPAGALVQPQSFTLHVPEQDIADFKALLRLSKIGPRTYENGISRYGVTRDWLAHAKETWLNSFKWRSHEEHINSFPNFKTSVEDLALGRSGIHFAALFSKNNDAIPVIFMHGWPGEQDLHELSS